MFFGEDKYEMSKEQYDMLLDSIDTVKRLSRNNLSSDEYKEKLRVEAERRKKINDNFSIRNILSSPNFLGQKVPEMK